MFGKHIAALGLAAAISACTCIAASAEENKVELIVSDCYDSITTLGSGLFVIDGAVVKAEVIDDEIATTIIAEDASDYEDTESDPIKGDITEGCDIAGYEFTLNIYDENGDISKTIPIDSDWDTTATLGSVTYADEQYEIVYRNAELYAINDKNALVVIDLREEDPNSLSDDVTIMPDILNIQIIELETGKVTDVSEARSCDGSSNWVVLSNGWLINDDVAFLRFWRMPTMSDYNTAIVDIATGEMYGDCFFGFSTSSDSNIHVVYDYDDYGERCINCRYIDNYGNVLSTFDNSEVEIPITTFGEDYAAVTQNGKVYLIDRNMRIVSDTFECEDIDQIKKAGDTFYLVSTADGDYIVTYAEKAATAPDTSDNADEGDDTTSDVPTDEVTGNDDTASDNKDEEANTDNTDNAGRLDGADDNNKTSAETGAAGVVGAAALAVTAIGAGVLSRRKK